MDLSDFFLAIYGNIRYEWCVVVLCLTFALYMIFSSKKTARTYLVGIAFSLYIVMIIGATLLGRTNTELNPGATYPFSSYKRVLVEHDPFLARQIILNVLVFVPFGIFLPSSFVCMKKGKVLLLVALFFSGTIELLQLICQCGVCEFDDLLHNTLGAMIGFIIWKHVKKVGKKHE